MTLWLTAANCIWIAASLVLFGLSVFPLYARAKIARAPLIIALLALAATVSAAAAVTLHITVIGATWADMAKTGLGQTWLAQLVIASTLVVGIWNQRPVILSALTGTQLAGFALVGHANAIAGVCGALLQGVHLLAAGGWIGGAIALAFCLKRADASQIVTRFSWAGWIFVATIGVTGGAVLVTNTGALFPASDTRYGQLVLTKIALTIATLICAAFNRFVATPRAAWQMMARVIAGEIALLLAIMFTAVLLAENEPFG